MSLDPHIPDYLASMGGRVSGVTAVFGTGQGLIADPFGPSQAIAAAPDAPTGAWTYWADLPNGKGDWLTQDGAEQWEWDFPTRLWLPRTDLGNMRRVVGSMYGAFRDVYVADRTLSGRVTWARISAFDIGSDDFWSWLDINVAVVEQVWDG